MSTQPPGDIVGFAQAGQKAWKIPASISIAQWAQESGWGKRMPAGSNNPFGIKARVRNGTIIDPYVMAGTDEEFSPDKIWHGPQPFRKFATLADAFDYHAKLLGTADVYAPARTKLPNVYEFARALTGVYATDTHYGDNLIAIIHGSQLQRFDT